MPKVPPKRTAPDGKEQSKLFIEKTREIGADEKRSAADKIDGAAAKDAARASK